MDWNAKWDCESFAAYGSKTTENPKKLQLVDWTIINDREIDAGSFNLSAGGGNYGSGSDGGHASSAKSSLSASDSFTRDEQTPDFRLLTYEGLSGDFNDNIELEGTKAFGTSPPLEASTGSVEPLNGLKLGKRTYFENGGGGGHVRSASSVVPNPSTTSSKRTKWPSQNLLVTRCVVEGCNVDLSAAKEYHRKHRVCESHSKSSKVVVGGLERRFCQQCSRFHNLSEFDEKKRSCRRRLSDHNARRRKPQQDAIQFNSARLSSPFYGGRHQTSLLFNNVPLLHSRNPCDTMSDSKFTLTTRGRTLKSTGNGVSSASKTSLADLSNLGGKGSQLDAGPEYGRALSLLSSNSWAPCGPALNPIHENDTMHEGVPLSSPEVWLQPHYQSTYNPPRLNSNSNANFQEIQLFITPTYEADLYSQIMN